MRAINDYSDKRHKGWCIHCGHELATGESSRDHVPTKSLLRLSPPANLPVVDVCAECNNLYSLDEEYFTVFLETVLVGSTDAEFAHNPSIARALKRNSKLKALIDGSKTEYEDASGEKKIIWHPEQERISRVVLKNARGHAYYEFGEPIFDEPEYVRAMPAINLTTEQLAEFENSEDGFGGWPEIGSRMMQRLMTGEDIQDGWIIVQDGIYRYSVLSSANGVRVRSVIFEYLLTDVCWSNS